MLFISILLSVWFVLWLIYAVFIKDTAGVIVSWIDWMTSEDEDETKEPEDEKMECFLFKCEGCGHEWWSSDKESEYCPKCGSQKVKGE